MNTIVYDGLNPAPITRPALPLFPPLARSAAGASIDEVLSALEDALHDGQQFVCLTLAWRRLLPFAEDREIARAQQRLVSRHRERVRKAGLSSPFILSVFEKTTKMGLHGHLMMGCPSASLEKWLAAIARQLMRDYGTLPPGFPWRDGRHGGKIRSPEAARGALKYRLKSLVAGEVEREVRRGKGLLALELAAVRLSKGRRR